MFNRLLVAALPLTPRLIVKAISRRYIAGETVEAALAACSDLQTRGFVTTLDILGESVTREDQAQASTTGYLDLIENVVRAGIERNISLKPSALGLALSEDLAFKNIRRIVERAQQKGLFIRIDMENSPYTEQTLRCYDELRKYFPGTGTVIQAYLKRSRDDVRRIAAAGGNLRICKGIYREDPAIAYQDRDEIRSNFLDLVTIMLEAHAYVGIATHDLPLLEQCRTRVADMQITPDRYEFQALLGVPIESELQDLMAAGHKVRIYVPFGSQWYAYASRRLQENPDIAGYVIRDLFRT